MAGAAETDGEGRGTGADAADPGGGHVAGVDEAGRGPLAGPVVVAAVILDPLRPIDGLADSKRLTARRREALAERIRDEALARALVRVEPGEVDALNVLHATMAGMARAVAGLGRAPARVLVDGDRRPDLAVPTEAIVGGDGREPAIAAASILAKVARDRCMVELDAIHPGYGFATHKGYATRGHLEALHRLGPCAAHRRSFAPVHFAASQHVLPLDEPAESEHDQ